MTDWPNNACGEPRFLRNRPDDGEQWTVLGYGRMLSGKRLVRTRFRFGRTRNRRGNAGMWLTHNRRTRLRRMPTGMQRTDHRGRRVARSGKRRHVNGTGSCRRIGIAAMIVVTGRDDAMRGGRRQTAGEGGAEGEGNRQEDFHGAKVSILSREGGWLHSK